jgi:CCR4-NOT complex subunit CAF16
MSLGKVKEWGAMETFELKGKGETGNSRLGELVLGWLKDDLQERGPRNRGLGSEGTAYMIGGIGGYGSENRTV